MMYLNSITPAWSFPGGTIELHGSGFGHTQGKHTPYINREFVHKLIILHWSDTKITAKIPAACTTGEYAVLVFTDVHPYGTSTVSKRLWLAMSPPPFAGADEYTTQVRAYRHKYGKEAEWETWMLNNKGRYIDAFNNSRLIPYLINISFRYENPIAYNPAWPTEQAHMNALAQLLDMEYPGYQFQVNLNAKPSDSYANIIAGIPTNNSFTDTHKNMFLYYEAIVNHEFGHVMGIHHHYDTIEEMGLGFHFPPGETGCTMDRNAVEYCSACRMALNLPLDVNNTNAINSALDNINHRYPKKTN